jgi:hypothetical protein
MQEIRQVEKGVGGAGSFLGMVKHLLLTEIAVGVCPILDK